MRPDSILARYFMPALTTAVLLVCLPCSAAGWNFTIPAEAFSHIVIEPGAWVRYRVIDEVMQQQDTSFIYVAVPKSNQPGNRLFWLELSGSTGEGDGGGIVVKLLVSESIKAVSPGDSIRSLIKKMYILEEGAELREGGDEDFSRLEETMGLEETRWKPVGKEDVVCPGGTFTSLREERFEKREKRINMGRSTLIKTVSDSGVVWFSDLVPVFGMVKYSLTRKTGTFMDPPIKGVPVSGLRVSRTEVELIGFGHEAESLLPDYY